MCNSQSTLRFSSSLSYSALQKPYFLSEFKNLRKKATFFFRRRNRYLQHDRDRIIIRSYNQMSARVIRLGIFPHNVPLSVLYRASHRVSSHIHIIHLYIYPPAVYVYYKIHDIALPCLVYASTPKRAKVLLAWSPLLRETFPRVAPEE